MSRWGLVAALIASLLAGAAGPAQAGEDQDLEEELKALRQVVEKQQKQLEALASQLKKLQRAGSEVTEEEDAGEAAVAETRLDALSDMVASVLEQSGKRTKVNLYGTVEYRNFTKGTSKFDARNIELLVGSEPYRQVRVQAEIEFEGTAQTSEGPRQGEVEVEQGWVELGFMRELALRGGVVLVPFGHYNLNHFQPLRELVDRPLMARRIIPSAWAEAGIGLVGTRSLPAGFGLGYQGYLVNGLTDRFTDTSTRGARGAFRNDNNNNKAVVGRAELTFPTTHRLGISGYYGDYDRNGHALAGVDVDWSFFLGDAELYGEYAYWGLQRGETSQGVTSPGMMQGVYAGMHYRFWPEFARRCWLAKRWPESLLTATLRWGFAEIEDDGDQGGGNNFEQRLSLGLNYRPVPTLALKLEYQINKSRREELEHGDADGFLAALSAAF